MKHPLTRFSALALVLVSLAGCDDGDEPFYEPSDTAPTGLNRSATCTGRGAGTPCEADGNECTRDVCDGFGNCNVPELNAPCEDGDGSACTGKCDAAGVCQPLQHVDGEKCDDGDGEACTAGSCQAGVCQPQGVDRGTACGPLDNPCMTDQCDGAGKCGIPIDAGTECHVAAIDACSNAACDGKGECKATGPKQAGDVCVPAAGAELCHVYSCQDVGGGALDCQGTCNLGATCETNGDAGTCLEPAGKQCGCYGVDGTACVGPEAEPVCALTDACSDSSECESGSACSLAAASADPGPYRFECAACDGPCPEPNPELLIEVQDSEQLASASACELSAAQGAFALLEGLRSQLVLQARQLCGSDHVALMAPEGGSYEWQCGGADASLLVGTARGYVTCLE
jgi:hypothetical protein